ncbi:MAG: hypothetical protein ACHQNT_00030 [Bacteroidia bacterium]
MRKHYFPKSNKKRLAWLKNFSDKIGTYASVLMILPTEAQEVKDYYTMLKHAMDTIEMVRSFSKSMTAFRKELMFGLPGGNASDVPVLTLPAAPAAVPSGIFGIISGMVQRMKGSIHYTEAIGEDLGIIGADFVKDFAALKAVLKIKPDLGRPEISYNKYNTHGMNLYVNRDDGNGMKFLKRLTRTTFIDKYKLPEEKRIALWKYIGIYVVDDIEVGIASDEVSVVVGR